MYVLLTGTDSNAGDFLIKDRALKLFKKFVQWGLEEIENENIID